MAQLKGYRSKKQRRAIVDIQSQKSDLHQTFLDAEARNKSKMVTYRRAFGQSLRRKLNLSKKAKNTAFSVLAAAYILYGAVLTQQTEYELANFIAWIIYQYYLLFGGILCCFATILAPDDVLYMDRLSIIVPGRNFMSFAPKVLWGKVEEIKLLDVAKPGSTSDFVMQLKQASGETTNIHLSALDAPALASIVEYMRNYAPHMRGLAQLNDVDRFLDYQKGKLPQISYTQLWESANQATFGLTSFTPLAPSTVIQQHYTVVKQFAAGGFSAIYLVQNEENEEFVLKESVLPPTLDEKTRAKAIEQFELEAKILARLNHPQITTVYDHFIEGGRNYLRLDYIKGLNMRQYVSLNSGQPEAKCVQWAIQLTEILKYLHELTPPVVHRDLSPDNIVIKENGQLMLVDFGAANEFIGQATGTLVGKHAYMAPEQIRGNAEPVSDLYALGACVYFALTAHEPEPIATIKTKQQNIEISDWLDKFITKCTQLEIDERFASAQDCLTYLKTPGQRSG